MPRRHCSPIKTIFLDFDGVLHPGNALWSECFVHAERLVETLAASRCEIVISSSWRFHHDFANIKRQLPKALANRVVGVTGDPVVGPYPRYNEIKEYLRYNPCQDWRALDDSRQEFPANCPELILCDGLQGLNDVVLKTLKNWLVDSVS